MRTDERCIFQLAGGLGNQLFGISEAYNLYRKYGIRILFMNTNTEHIARSEEFWENLRKYKGDWFDLMPPKLFKDFSLVERINMAEVEDVRSLEKEITRKIIIGWRPKLSSIRESGFFEQHRLPWLPNPDFSERNTLGIHLRFGDYKNTKSLGGNLTLSLKYLRKLVSEELEFSGEVNGTFVCTDSINEAVKVVSKLHLVTNQITFSSAKDPYLDMARLAQCRNILASGSTFSFWAAYFSHAKCFFPSPFYFSNPNWEDELLPISWRTVSRKPRFRNKFI